MPEFLWTVRAQLVVPMRQREVVADGVTRLEFSPQIQNAEIIHAGHRIVVAPWNNGAQAERVRTGRLALSELWAASVDVNAITGQDALTKAMLPIESFCDQMAFALQAGIAQTLHEVRASHTIDLLRVENFQPPKFQSSIYLNERQIDSSVDIRDYEGERERAALRWYHKALAAQYDVDKFVFFWIALEILCVAAGVTEILPYKSRCGHEIKNCPTCSASTSVRVSGPSIKRYLTERLLVPSKIAKELWKLRQMLHGANELTVKKSERIPSMNMQLHSVITKGLKIQTKLKLETPPVVAAEGVAIGALGLNIVPGNDIPR